MSAHQNGPLLVRADAGVRIGTGHVMRCLALAQAWQDAGGKAIFCLGGESSGLWGRLAKFTVEWMADEPGSAEDSLRTVGMAHSVQASWVVVDGYHFTADYQRRLKDAGLRVLAIDDHRHSEHYWADLVLNQNLTADERLYEHREAHTRLLLGTRYALIRREFNAYHAWQRQTPEIARRVLVTLGGADPDNVSLKVIRALRQVAIPKLEAVVLVGSHNPHRPALEEAVHESGPGTIRLSGPVDDMAVHLRWADVAVAAGGATSWERALLGLPGLILVLADNQAAVAASLDDAGLSWNLGRAEDVSESRLASALTELCRSRETRAAMTARAQELIDGFGAGRVLTRMCPDQVGFRSVRAEDCRLVWQWSNDPVVRQASFSSDPIPWEEHERWFAGKLNEPTGLFLVAIGPGGVPLGQVRFELRGREALISLSLAPECRGWGLGPSLIRKASRLILEDGRADVVGALVRRENQASHAAFARAGFAVKEQTCVKGIAATRFVLSR